MDEQEFLPAHLHPIWTAFTVLSRSRNVNQIGPQPIQIGEVRHYCDLDGVIDEEDRRELLFHVMELDAEWMTRKYAEIETERDKLKKQAEKNGTRGRRR
ncbi:hypothetical protein KEU06_09640 [Pseudaminobacter sp. 19-2017]|uniref:Uncharacterized protein n=1 Tax=Pseudaminobacter soli (ex Zhang et al. 2022) TaxID=2831468 RepID=A0A942DX64_9HYPH|nr:hypothetical protein [Pseudaminobacter soli]MBS3648868.1 hypothetical protein [Pseudaminobacter soli]